MNKNIPETQNSQFQKRPESQSNTAHLTTLLFSSNAFHCHNARLSSNIGDSLPFSFTLFAAAITIINRCRRRSRGSSSVAVTNKGRGRQGNDNRTVKLGTEKRRKGEGEKEEKEEEKKQND